MNFEQLSAVNVNDRVEKKEDLVYLSWSWAWHEFKMACPDATYKIIKNADGLPYFETDAGVMVFTEVSTGGITHEMWLPVMNGANKAMKREAYTYKTKYAEKGVDAFDVFDVNKTLMRCLTKNLAMFGLALYLYAGEDLPEPNLDNEIAELNGCETLQELQETYLRILPLFKKMPAESKLITKTKDVMKAKLAKDVQ